MSQMGKKGGAARAKKLTKAERIAIATKGGEAGGRGRAKKKSRSK